SWSVEYCPLSAILGLENLPIANPTCRDITVVILNHTKDGLDLDPESNTSTVDSGSPQTLYHLSRSAPEESVLWHCKSTGMRRGVDGSVTYRMSGAVPHDKVRFCWKIRYFGINHYETAATRDGYIVRVVVFVF
ncbi:hypothetical protein BKA67DRAFT_119739, partial [Truncatella angustata]